METFRSRALVLATGGVGRVYQYTTNPSIATGDGVAMAYRAGVEVMNMEFVQFHPTTLYTKTDERFLITEEIATEIDDLVAEQRGVFKLQLTRRGLHLLLEVLDEASQLFLGTASAIARLGELVPGVVGGGLFRDPTDLIRDVTDGLLNGDGLNSMLLVVDQLGGAAPGRFVDGALHGVGHHVGVEDGLRFDVAGGTTDGLDHGAFAAEVALLVSVEDGNKAHLR